MKYKFSRLLNIPKIRMFVYYRINSYNIVIIISIKKIVDHTIKYDPPDELPKKNFYSVKKKYGNIKKRVIIYNFNILLLIISI